MNKTWEQIELGTIASFRNGLNFNKDSRGKGCLIIGIPDFQDYFKPKYEELGEINPDGLTKKDDYVQNGDILFVRSNGNKALVGRSLFIDKDIQAVFSGFCIRLRFTTNNILPIFYAYFTRTERFRALISAASGGANIQNLNQGILSRVKVPNPPLPIQHKIATILSAYDDLIENNLKRIKLLEEKAQLSYEEWFVRLKFPGYENTPIEKETGLPEGWKKEYFEDNLNFKTGKLDSNALEKDGTYDFYTCAKEILKTNTFCFEGEAVLLGGNNATGDFALFYANDKFDAYQRTYIVTSKNGKLPLVFVFHYLKMLLPYFQIVSSGASTKFLTMKILNKTKILIPSKDILEKFGIEFKQCFDLILKLQKQNRLLKEARDILLPRLMTGMIDV